MAANRQRSVKINLALLEKIAESLLAELKIGGAELEINIVSAEDMTRLNEKFLQHKGSTDVITFDYTNSGGRRFVAAGKSRTRTKELPPLCGEILICVEEAVLQAKKFRTSWQSELVRYVVHGVLHLLGYSDLRLETRRKMKCVENRLVRGLAGRFSLAELGPDAKLARCRNR